MKRKSQILIMLLVSMMIAYVGAGTLVAQCSHTGLVEAVDTGCHDGCCHSPKKACMTISVKTLNPVVNGQQTSVESPAVATLPADLMPDFGLMSQQSHQASSPYNAIVEKSPPRCYLNFIQVLLI